MLVRQLRTAAPPLPKRKRVAAYARVSSGKEAMLHSLSAQISYYSESIATHSDWEYMGVFADEAVTGTKDNRPEFQKMLQECRAGNIDLILTKSISRFARNTVTVLESVRALKSLGVDVFFEEQNIHSMSAEGEVMLTILSSYAQEESRSASENCKWRIRKDFREGKISGMKMRGYRVHKGRLRVVPQEAERVRSIFADYLSGMGISAIMRKCRKQGLAISAFGIFSMLRNEKYTGDLLLQKRFKSDHITKRLVKNTGQLPQYYVTGSHEPIVSKETFLAVQAEIARRASMYNKPKIPRRDQYAFTGMIKCGICGAAYKRKHAAAGSKYEKIVWICITFDRLGKDVCASQQIPEDILMAKCAEILRLDAFDKNALRSNVQTILVTGHGKLDFVFADGHHESTEWKNPSRKHSWTAEMREAARQRAYRRHREARP
ncbi:MAG: recombinase family protein [Oscillospiraceae bacterium]|nr:recombinase family protein [Oscillospiraceae bacterium]